MEKEDQEMQEINVGLKGVSTAYVVPVEKEPKEEKEGEQPENNIKKLLMFDVKPVSVWKLYYTLSDRLDVFYMILGLIGSLGSGVMMPLFSILFGDTISGYGPRATFTDFQKSMGDMIRNFLVVGAAAFVAYFLNIGLWTLAGRRQVLKMKAMYFTLIMKQEQGWFDSTNAYEFSTKVQAQIKQIEGGVGEKFGMAVMGLGQFCSGMIISFTTSWKLSIVLMACLPFIAVAIVCMAKSLKNGMTEARKAYEKAGGLAEEVLYNIKTVASFGNFDFEINRYKKHIEECKDQGINNSFKTGLGMGFVYFFLFITYMVAILYGSHLIVDKDFNSNAGRVFLAGDVITVLFSSVMAAASLGQVAPNLKAAADACIAASDFFQLMDRKPEIDYTNSTEKPDRSKLTGRIIFSNVSFAYPSKPDQKILKNINISFEPGQKVALVGASGSGKSTVVNLIERLYESQEGTITIDGIDIRNFDIQYLRNLIGYVQQEPVLFNRSIKSNIIFGREALFKDNEEIDRYIKEACEDSYASEFIDKIDGKYDYVVGIKGSKLSGGQKQRIAIARAILTKPKVLLLDEATSALDNKSEKEVQKALDIICQKQVTTIIVAHRLSTVKNADKIIAIKNGVVMEVGTHTELLEKDGYYASLVKSQICAEQLEEIQNKEVEVGRIQSLNIASVPSERQQSNHINNEEVQALQNVPVEEEKDKYEVKRGKLLSLLTDNKCNIAIATIGSAAVGAIFPIYGLLLSSSINVLSNKDDKAVLDDGLFLAMMFIVVAVASGIGVFLQNYKFGTIGEILTSKLRNLVFEKYLRLHLGYFDIKENTPGSLLTKLSLDTTLLNGLVLTLIGVSVQSTVNLLLGLIMGFVFDWRLSLISIGFLPFMVLAGHFAHKMRQGFVGGEDNLEIEAGGILSECVINTKTIFSYNFQQKGVEMYLEILEHTKNNFCKDAMSSGFLFALGQFTNFASYATLFYAGGEFIMEGSLEFNNMTRAIMVILFAAFGVGLAQQHVGDLVKAKNAFKSLFSTIDLISKIDTTVEYNEGKRSAEGIKGKIEFRNVSFAYPTRPSNMILKNVNFVIQPGQAVAFVGHSGNGKSTIIQLLERFYDPYSGQILIDDVDITEYNLLSLRKKIGLVMQEPCLFKRDVKENIRYGKLDATEEEIREAAQKANIMKFFTEKDDGTKDSPVSGGEKQRLAIARLFLKNPVIMLLDEATSALDKESEKEVQKSLDVLKGGKTSITIAHRLSTIESSDVIYVLDGGIIVEQGTHSELYEKKGRYYTLHKYSS